MNQKKALDKIRKCLALAKSSNANEAAAALRQAQALMRKYDLSDKDIEGAEATFREWKSPYTGTEFVTSEIILIGIVIKSFGVRGVCVFRNVDGKVKKTMRFAGTEGRETLATWALTVLMRAMNSAWLEYRDRVAVSRYANLDRESFRVGWATAVQSEVQDMALTEKQQAIIEAAMEADAKGMVKQPMGVKEKPLDRSAANAGFAAGKKFKLHRPMGADENAEVLKIGRD